MAESMCRFVVESLRRARPVGLLLVATLLFTACAAGPDAAKSESGDEPGRSPDIVRAAAKTTSEAGTAAFEMRMSTTGEMAGQELDMTVDATGAYDFESGDMEMDMAAVMPGLGDMDMQARMVDGVMYIRYQDSFMSQMGLPAGVTWISMDLGNMTGLSAGQMQSMGGQFQDPTQFLAFLEAAGAEIEEVGSEEVDGFETTHYRARTDFAALMEEQSEALEGMLGSQGLSGDALGAMSEVEIPMDVWIDNEGRVRRIRIEMDMSEAMSSMFPGQGDAGTRYEIEVEQDFSDFGLDVDVEAPPADETTDFADLDLFPGTGGF